VVILACGLSAAAAAADFDGSTPLTCASTEVFECDAGGAGCRAVSADSIAAPRFLKLDLRRGEITTSRNGTPEKMPTPQHAGGRLVMQGVIGEERPDNAGLAWSLAIDETSGNMVLSASGEDAAFVIFGACTTI
jgi:hypothetical protein